MSIDPVTRTLRSRNELETDWRRALTGSRAGGALAMFAPLTRLSVIPSEARDLGLRAPDPRSLASLGMTVCEILPLAVHRHRLECRVGSWDEMLTRWI